MPFLKKILLKCKHDKDWKIFWNKITNVNFQIIKINLYSFGSMNKKLNFKKNVLYV